MAGLNHSGSRRLAIERGLTLSLWRRPAAIALTCSWTLFAPPAGADEELSVRRLGPDLLMLGGEVQLEEEVTGDALLIGSTVDVAALVHGDGVIAGRELDLRGPFLADLYAAGRSVRLDGSVAGNARIAGGEVSLGPDSAIDGGTSIVARRAEIAGTVGGYLHVVASDTTVSGRVAGDLDVSGEALHVAPSAEIAGELMFTGPEPASVAPGARVHGKVRHVPSGDADESGGWSAVSGVFAVVSALGMAAVGAALWALWPNFTRSVVDAATRRRGRAFLTGLAVAVGCPLAIALLFISIVGVPLAAFAACGYLISFPLGYLLAGATIAESLLERFRLERFRPPRAWNTTRRMLALLSSFLLLAMLAFVPVIGPLSIAALTLLGIGAFALAGFDAYRYGWRGQEPGRPREGAQSATPGPANGAAHST